MNGVCKGLMAAVLSIALWFAPLPLRGEDTAAFAKPLRVHVKPHLRDSSSMDSRGYTISGYVMTPDGTGLGGVLLTYTDGTMKTVPTGLDGAYSFRVSRGWSGKVTPSKPGSSYTFVPARKEYTSVRSDKPNQNYIANLPPTDILLSSTNVAENLPGGTTVGTLTTIDADGGGATYSFCSAVDNPAFRLSGSSLKTADAFNFETKNTYNICIRADDQHGGILPKAFSIRVINVNEPPTNVAISPGNVIEKQEIGTAIGTLTTTDQDTTDWHSYLLTNGGACTDNSFFGIDNNQLFTVKSIPDFNVKQNYSICIRSIDSGGLSYDKNINLEVIPTFQIIGSTEISGYTIKYKGTYISKGISFTWSGQFNAVDPDYTLIVPKGWMGTVIPSRNGYLFRVPEDPTKTFRTYPFPLGADQANQDFEARPRVSGNVGIGGARVCHDEDGPKCVLSNPNGSFRDSVPYCWYGALKAAKPDYIFSPPRLSLSCVTQPASGLAFEVALKSPKILYPKNKMTLFGSNKPTVEWKKLSTVKSYVLSVCDPYTGVCPVPEQNVICNTATCRFTTAPLTAGKIYKLCVKAQDRWGHQSVCKPVHFFMGFKMTFEDVSYQRSWRSRPEGSWLFDIRGYIYTNGLENTTSSISYNRPLRNFAFQAKVAANPGSASGLIIRASPPINSINGWNNAYYFQITPEKGTFKVLKFLGGADQWPTQSIKIPDNVPVNLNTWNTLKVNVYENHLTFYINGREVHDVYDADNPLDNGQVGIYLFDTGWLKVDEATLFMPLLK